MPLKAGKTIGGIIETYTVSYSLGRTICHSLMKAGQILSVLDMWINNMIRLLQSNLDSEEKDFYFMDGPYCFKMTGIKKEMVKIIFVEHDKQVNEKPYEVLFNNFLSECIEVIADIIMDE